MSAYVEKKFTNRHGLNISYRDYANGASQALPVLCLTGAPDNARVYDDVASHLAAQRRVLVMDWRGHGRSDYDPDWERYSYVTDRDDVVELLAHERLPKVVMIGTSLGGIVVIHMGAHRLDLMAAAVINDIGPVIGETGKQRLLHNNAQTMVFDSFEAAAEAMKQRLGVGVRRTFAEWLEQTHRIYRRRDDGKVVPDVDPVYNKVVRGRNRPPDWWAYFESMKEIPMLMVRGEVSDVLEAATVAEMKRRKPDLDTVTVAGRGHCPVMDEPDAAAAIDAFLAKVP